MPDRAVPSTAVDGRGAHRSSRWSAWLAGCGGGGSTDAGSSPTFAGSLQTKNVKLRTMRMLSLLDRLNDEAGSTPTAAITYPPRAFERHPGWWPGFPWSDIAGKVDAIVPMLYTGGGFKGYDATYGYVARSLRLLRAAVGDDIVVHAAGGVANRMSKEELRAFDDAVLDDGTATGWSLYDFQTTTPVGWAAMARLGQSLG